jgi:hypothetical protein
MKISGILVVSVFILISITSCSKSGGPNAPLTGNWTFVRQHEEAIMPGYYLYFSYPYNNDTFAVNFAASGTYTLTYRTSALNWPTTWGTEDGTYAVQDSILSITTAFTGALFGILHVQDTPLLPVRYKLIGTDTLVTFCGWGTPGIPPYDYDSVVLAKVR